MAGMRPSTLCRGLSAAARLAPSPVAPMPERTEFDEWLASELDELRVVEVDRCCSGLVSCEWISRAMKVAIETQRRAAERAVNGGCPTTRGRRLVDAYLEGAIELLDGCNGLRETTESTRRYVALVGSISRCLGRGPTGEAVERALSMLAALERVKRDGNELGRLRKLGKRMQSLRPAAGVGGELEEALHASISTAALATGSLAAGLSFKFDHRVVLGDKKSRRVGSSWVTVLDELSKRVKADQAEKGRTRGRVPLLNELSHVVTTVQKLGKLLLRQPENDDGRRREFKRTVESLGRSCNELEQGIKMLELRINELYRSLISVRVALLGTLSGS
ncbi:hypothetical protein H6P81_001598 [Aristolochia fimbriata]|uniref:Uncharacterized protein n=1 Tax=Aristolochia fimbriata TaxID=158543 RepID=A0AAV7FA22_ARIFI|nr:hypothetical protein H6P81_001598 [Aristolochia fimbriata]